LTPAARFLTKRRVPVLVLALSSVTFALMAMVAKVACARLPGPEVAFVRFAVGVAACAGAALQVRLRARNWTGLALRGVFGGAAVLCYFLAIAHLTVGVATLLNYTSPVFTTLFAALFLRERLGPALVGALAVTTCGVALVIRADAPPGMLGLGTWQLVGMGASVLSGAAIATIRQVRKTDGSWEIFAAFCVVGAVVCGAVAARAWVAPTAREWAMLGLVGALAVAAQLGMTWALRYVSAGAAGVLMQLTPVAAIALGWVALGERAAGLALAGAAVTLVGVTWGAWLAASA
jgi:drug/metabolite transporter (DMT)-like permease